MTDQTYTFTTADEPDYLYDDTKVSIGPSVAKLIGGYDTSYKVIMHLEGDLTDSSSYARAISLQDGADPTYEAANTPPSYGLGAQFGVFGAASPSTHKFPVSADFKLQNTSRFEIHLLERNDLNAAFAPYPVMGISVGLGDSGACTSNTVFMQWANNGNDMQFNFGGTNCTFVGVTVDAAFPPNQGTYSTAALNHLLISFDGTTLRFAINGGFHITTYTLPTDITWSGNPNLYLYGGRPSRTIRRDEFIFRKDCSVGDVRTVNFTPGATETSAGTGYSQTNPLVEPESTFSQAGITSIVDSQVALGSDSITYVLRVEGTNYWWNGTTWWPSNGYPESNTAAQIRAYLGSFTAQGDTLIFAYLHSADGTTTPELTSLTVDYTPLSTTTGTRHSEGEGSYSRYNHIKSPRRYPRRKRTILLHGAQGDQGKWYKCWNCGYSGNHRDREQTFDSVLGRMKHSIVATIPGTTNPHPSMDGYYVNAMRNGVTRTGKTVLTHVGFQDVHSVKSESGGGCAFCGCLNYR